MLFKETKLRGAWIIELDLHEDFRGWFARTFCAREFSEHGLAVEFVQGNISFTRKAGTIRGMHNELPPSKESKLVRCIRGAIHDVIVDLRVKSPTHLQHVSVELTTENHRALYVPPEFAHGFQTLVDDTEVLYQMGDFFHPDRVAGLRYDDPRLGIAWPLPVSVISQKDLAWPFL